jgi:hypothetical protein
MLLHNINVPRVIAKLQPFEANRNGAKFTAGELHVLAVLRIASNEAHKRNQEWEQAKRLRTFQAAFDTEPERAVQTVDGMPRMAFAEAMAIMCHEDNRADEYFLSLLKEKGLLTPPTPNGTQNDVRTILETINDRLVELREYSAAAEEASRQIRKTYAGPIIATVIAGIFAVTGISITIPLAGALLLLATTPLSLTTRARAVLNDARVEFNKLAENVADVIPRYS